MLQWTWECIYLFKLVFSYYLNASPKVDYLGHMVIVVLIFWEISIVFSIVASPIYIPTNSVFRHASFQIFADTCCFLIFFIIAILMGMKILIFISLIISDDEHLSMCLLPCLEKWLIRSSVHFFVVCYWVEFFVYFGYQHLIRYVICKKLPFGRLSFCFIDVYLCCAEAFYFNVVPFVYFLFYFPCLRRHIQEDIAKTNVSICYVLL